jgi:hypothetical protein
MWPLCVKCLPPCASVRIVSWQLTRVCLPLDCRVDPLPLLQADLGRHEVSSTYSQLFDCFIERYDKQWMKRKGRAMDGSVAQFEALSGHLRGKTIQNRKMSHYKLDRGRVVGMATGIRYRRTAIRIPVGTRYILPSKRLNIAPGVHTDYCPMCTVALCRG